MADLLTADQCAAYVEALNDGRSTVQARTDLGVTRAAVVATCKANPEFMAKCEEAKTTRAASLLELAEHATVTATDNATAAMAKALTSAAAQLAEKLAPREYGQLVKLGADQELGPALVQVISFARPIEPAPAPIALEAKDVPIDATHN